MIVVKDCGKKDCRKNAMAEGTAVASAMQAAAQKWAEMVLVPLCSAAGEAASVGIGPFAPDLIIPEPRQTV
jgi:hypothetical protein